MCVYIYERMSVCMHVCMHAYMCVYTHILTDMHEHMTKRVIEAQNVAQEP